MNRLKDKRALVTGGTSGIGLETARHFLNEGAKVAITGNNPVTLESARKELGSEVLFIKSDAGKALVQKAVAETLRQAFGQIDVLFINAGIADLRPVEGWDEAAFDRNLRHQYQRTLLPGTGPVACLCKSASIVLNASVNAHIGMPLSGELISRGIRVKAVSPGPISTPLYSKLGLSETDLKTVSASIQSQVPAGRFGGPAEIANAIVFFASDESAFMVGGKLMIDGGIGTL
jgi:NAD(P)-dependent dehydrogenase (short-subunit alcohol dehydrogenase family)